MKPFRDRLLKRRTPPRRKGIAALFVLGLLAMALAISYAMLRTQSVSQKITNNTSRTLDARAAAMAGMSHALRRIHDADWAGVDVGLSETLSSLEGFNVVFETGDASLTTSDPEYGEYPFRLTITSTGYAIDPGNSSIRAEHQVSAVVQLVRREFYSQPSGWTALQQYTLYQWDHIASWVQFPVQVDGPSLFREELNLAWQYPEVDEARERYLSDLEQMRVAGFGDYRPFTDSVSLPYDHNSSTTLTDLQTRLNLTTHNVSSASSQPTSHPGNVTSYQLYPGGKEYSVPNIPDELGYVIQDVSLQPDVVDNPLGIYRWPNDLYVDDNVVVQGTLISYDTGADLFVRGDNVQFKPVDLPPLEGSSEKRQLPTVLIIDDLRVFENAKNNSLTGLAMVWDELEFKEGASDVAFDLQGAAFVREVILRGRSAWNVSSSQWQTYYDDFIAQLSGGSPELYFPRWLNTEASFDPEPLLTIKPQSDQVTYHWQNWNSPIYVPHADDDGLMWTLIDWQDAP